MKSDAFRAAAESKDFSALDRIFATEASFRSPAVFRPYQGLEAIGLILGAVAEVLEDFRYTEQVETGDTAALAFSARVGDREVEGIDLLRFDGESRVRELAVYVRPLSGLQALTEAMGRKLEQLGAATGS